jgi:membrane fusion protein (multidrug efflux system)
MFAAFLKRAASLNIFDWHRNCHPQWSRGEPLGSVAAKRGIKSFCFLALGMAVTSGCHRAADAPPQQGPIPVETAAVRLKSVPLYGNWVATTDGYVNAQIQPQVSGYLVRQDYAEGAVVNEGQVLFEIDPRPFEAQLDLANGALEQAQAQLELQQINVKRDAPLVQTRAISQSQLDRELKQQQAAQANVAMNQAQVRTAELNLGFTKVRSLVTGIAGQAKLQVGNLVSPGSVLTSVSQVDPIKVYFSISEQEYLTLSNRLRVQKRQDLLSNGHTVPLELTLANGEIYPHPGYVIFVDRSVSDQTGSLRIAGSFPNPGNLLRPSQFGRIKVQTDVRRNAPVIPQRALNEVQGSYQVAVVQPNKTVKLVTVELGPEVGEDIVIEHGLTGHEQIVTEGIGKLRDGAAISPQAEQKSASAPAIEGQKGQ